MKKKQNNSQPLRLILILAVVIPVILLILVSTIGRRDFNLPHKFSLEFLGVFQSGISRFFAFNENIWDHYINLVNVSQENEQLREEIRLLKARNVEYREAAATNIRLTKLLDLERNFEEATLTARIIGRDPSIWFKTLIVDRGSSSGVEKGMPVITVEGVVGQIVNTSPHYSKVLLAIDPNSAIDALVQKNRVQGIIKGKGDAYQLHYVLKNSLIEEGDLIVTSGLGGVFPNSLPIGSVSSVLRSKRGMFQRIEIEPAVNFRQLEHVVIVLTVGSLIE